MTKSMTYQPDPIVESVRNRMKLRAIIGQHKYNKTMERTDLDTVAWLRHLQEELMDGAIYVERVIHDLMMEMNDGK